MAANRNKTPFLSNRGGVFVVYVKGI